MAIHWMGRVQGAMQFRAAASVLAAASVVARGERVVQARLAAALSRLDLERTEAERISRELEQCRDLEHELGGKDAGGDEALLALARREAHALQQRLAALQRALERDTQLQARLVRELQERHGGGAAGDPDHGGGDDTQQVRSLFLEVLPGAGGREAAIFADELFHMYHKYATRQGWKFDRLGDCLARVSGAGAYARLRHEAGGMRVQRVPVTETQGRLHTSLAFVVVMPERAADNIGTLRESDIRMESFRASGAGGQHVNKTDSAVRLTHTPTGITVAIQSTRSQHQNREIALQLLRTRIREAERRQAQRRECAQRRQQLGTGARHERIRTFHFPRDQVIDHRVNVSVSDLSRILNQGDLDRLPVPE
ncbi:hypothetical protein CDCA_CDCA10G3072 [Cyanidium caldarium]|uniref:Prokaryotic-type class I peptide chain release factors domain-containing protein n=1 Tax=Cyanidium caldarium TaxID=2771 RepID=A0AAV9IXI6_CYACA|nr:hypothetical protein CDCA_CDCA10G3072 [Cyanidium caldarium]